MKTENYEQPENLLRFKGFTLACLMRVEARRKRILVM
jgi:hypothetical protein